MLVLRSVPEKALTKTVSLNEKTGDYIIGDYDNKITHFRGDNLTFKNFEEMADALDLLEKDTNACVVRGALGDNVNPKYFMRRKIKNPEHGAITDVDQRWVCIDVDNFPLSALGYCPLAEAPARIKELLPTCFKNARCWWQFSASQGFKTADAVSVHFWFWLDDDVSNSELKRYFAVYNDSMMELFGHAKFVDPALFDPIQIHYTARPNLIYPVTDPLEGLRTGRLGGTAAVALTEDWLRVDPNDDSAVTRYLSRVGDDKDGFHQPLLSASAAFVRRYAGDPGHTEQFKVLARDVIDRADKSGRSESQISRYKSDNFLDKLIQSAITKGFDQKQAAVDGQTAEFFKGFVFASVPNKFYQPSSDDFISPSAFDLIARPFLKISGASKAFQDSGGQTVNKIMCLPGAPAKTVVTYEGAKVFNKWEGRQGLLLDRYDVKPFLEHIDYLCDGREKVRDNLLDYFAYIIANPGKKVKWAPVIGSSVGGTGKSILKIPLRAIYGRGMREIGTEDLRSTNNPHMESELIVVEEVYGPDNRAMVNMIKASVTESRISINIKHVPQYEAPNFANFLMFTNHRVPFPVDPGDRRFMFIYSGKPPKPQEYYDGLVAWLEASTDHIYTWAMKRDLSGFNPNKAPLATDEREQIIQSSRSSLAQKIIEARDGLSWPLQHDIVSVQELHHAINNSLDRKVTLNALTQLLEETGFYKIPKRLKLQSGAQVTAWIIRDFEKYQAMDHKAIGEIISAKRIGSEKDFYQSGAI